MCIESYSDSKMFVEYVMFELFVVAVLMSMCINGYLLLTRKAAHPSFGTFGKKMSNCCPCLANGCGTGGFSSAHTITLGHSTAPSCGALAFPRWICQHWLSSA